MHVVPPHVGRPHDGIFVHRWHFVGSLIVAAVHPGEVIGCVAMSAQLPPLQIVQQPKQSQPTGVFELQKLMHVGCNEIFPTGGGQAAGSYPVNEHWAAVVMPRMQHTWTEQPSSPDPLFPSKKQSISLASMLSPAIPEPNEASSLSIGIEHSTSAESIAPSPSSSLQFVQAVEPATQPAGASIEAEPS